MTARTTEFGTRNAVSQAPAGAAAQSGSTPSAPDQFERFLTAFAAGGIHKAAADAAGLALDVIAAKLDDDADFRGAYQAARRTRRMLIEDAVMEEALGDVRTDPVNGVTRRVRNVDVLKRLAVKEDVLDSEKPTTQIAIQNNQQTGPRDPKLRAAVADNSAKLRALLLGHTKPALPNKVIDAVATPVDPDSDLI